MTLEPIRMVYCSKCSMPPEYCEYGPDYERVCEPYLKRKHPGIYAKLQELKGNTNSSTATGSEETATNDDSPPVPPLEPWTTEERLTKFYEKYVPEKVGDVPSLLEKYAGKEDKLFIALVKKYGPEPEDPYYADSDDDDDEIESGDDENDLEGGMEDLTVNASSANSKKRRGIKAKKSVKAETRVVIQKVLRNRKKATTVVVGMDTVENLKLKDVSKAFSKRFAGSSSVKDGPRGKEIIIQGDHMEDVAEMIATKFKVGGSCIFLDYDGQFVPYK